MSSSVPGVERALPPAEGGMLADVVARVEGRPEDSAFSLIERAEDALLWRLALIDSATESLDIQYFIWKGDESGTLVFSRVIEAAQRGVRIRVLIDDLNLRADEDELAALDLHPNIGFRLWNPPGKRMHNKIVLADGHFGLTGGRSVANEYFGLDEKYNFLDLDVLVAGPVVAEMGAAFDEYWNSELSIPAKEIGKADAPPATLTPIVEAHHELIDQGKELLSRFPTRRADWAEHFEYLPERWYLGRAQWLQDDPVGADIEKSRLLDMIDLTTAPVQDELYLVSAYLIPVGDLLANIKQLVANGVRVKVVTGTMEAVNHTASYAHYRTDVGAILDTGAELYEVDGQPSEARVREAADTPPVSGRYMAIHLKGLVVDREKCFIGSLNLDPRALVINTEGGLYIESAGLGAALADWFDVVTSPGNAWRVTSDDTTGNLTWTSGDETREKSPDRGPMQRFVADFFESLPIRSQL